MNIYKKFPKNLKEQTEQQSQTLFDSVKDQINKFFLNPNNYVYRGLKKEKIGVFDSPTNREPKDSTQQEHEIFNNWLEANDAIANRSNSVFITGSISTAQEYGTPHIVFPLNHFDCAYAHGVDDWYSCYEIRTELEDWNIEKVTPENIFKLSPAIHSGWEIMLSGKYLIIPVIEWNKIKKKLLENLNPHISRNFGRLGEMKKSLELLSKHKFDIEPWFLKNPLYRGVKSQRSGVFDTPSNRTPKDFSQATTDYLNDKINEKGLDANRSNSIFCTGISYLTMEYGHTHVVLPFKNSNYTYLENCRDWFVDWLDKTKDGTPIEERLDWNLIGGSNATITQELKQQIAHGIEIMVNGKYLIIPHTDYKYFMETDNG